MGQRGPSLLGEKNSNIDGDMTWAAFILGGFAQPIGVVDYLMARDGLELSCTSFLRDEFEMMIVSLMFIGLSIRDRWSRRLPF